MIVDIHAHYHARAFHVALRAMPGWGGGRGFGGVRLPDPDAAPHVEARLQMMDEAGVGVQVLSAAAGWAPYSADQKASVNAARIANDTTAELVSRHPNRFKAFVS